MDIVIVFPGQASQYVGMGKDLFDQFDYVKALFEIASDSLKKDVSAICFDGSEEVLRLTENTQPAIFTVSLACYEVLNREFGLKASIAAGHSLGEYSALVCSGVLEFSEAVEILRKRGKFMQEAVPPDRGAMAAIIGLSQEEVDDILDKVEGVVETANMNGAGQIVISGEKGAVLEAVDRARAAKAKRAVELPVSAPFHCSLMAPAAERLKPFLQELHRGRFAFPVVANLTGDRYASPSQVPLYLEKQICSPVRWEESMRRIYDSGNNMLLEAGPGKVLTGLARRMLDGWMVASFGSMEDMAKVESIVEQKKMEG